jgi:hypothetical protein
MATKKESSHALALIELRREIEASGVRLLDRRGLRREICERRGGCRMPTKKNNGRQQAEREKLLRWLDQQEPQTETARELIRLRRQALLKGQRLYSIEEILRETGHLHEDDE